MSQHIFADSLNNIVLSNGMVRIHFATATYTEKDGQISSVMDAQCAVAMTPKAFLQAVKQMNDTIEKMKNAGILVHQGEERRSGPARSSATITTMDDARKKERKEKKDDADNEM